ncbi:tetratricopeptide repeat protein [Aggregicoccus sp. 17bor-14]|uniref:tetratricopeptide repeat protein n=1 Tax=Myxococcaceae TaxID=31 RepID=UPI00129C288E|nr:MULTISPECIES: tetratricopeptide repeat protein [Myxococcaceae]MBF5044029.1 tetratricopeptide repeat protein [Simulacricoccus sp. 17bor-14]MRI89780.1 tetratricopeptide repeat protein [Aggregicoccus sp. 17bor-14]
MNRLLALTLSLCALAALAPTPALAQQEAATLQRALALYDAGNDEAAAPLLYDVAAQTADVASAQKAQLYLAQSFARHRLPVSALLGFASIVNQGPSHPFQLEAVEGLVQMQALLDEQNLVPNVLAQAYTEDAKDRWVKLKPDTLARINYLVASIHQRRGQFEQARALLEAVPQGSRVFAKSRYLLGVVLADPRFPGRPGEKEALDKAALAAFQSVVDVKDPKQQDGQRTRELALLGLGRLHYGRGEYAEASRAYEAVPRYSTYWDQALFENGFARFQNEDFGGALGSLQALHAPQFAGAFQPESWILKATVYYYSCLFDESKTALAAFEQLYEPMLTQIKPLLGDDTQPTAVFDLVSGADTKRLPRPVYLWIRNNERVQGVIRTLGQIDAEKRAFSNVGAWRGSRMAPESVAALDANRTTLQQVGGTLAKSRLKEAADNLRTFGDQTEIIRVQTALDEKDLLAQGVDQKKLLTRQSLYRPKIPGADWNYWKFQGEFWIDEIGYYQYTLKRGCPARAQE